MRQRRWPIVVVAMLGALAAGCGTTVRLPPGYGTTLGSGMGPEGLGGPGAGGTAPGGSGGSAAAPGAPGTQGAGGAGGAAPGGAAAGSGPGQSGGGPAALSGSAPGVTATTIAVGVPYEVNGGAANKAIGGNGITQGDAKGETQTVINNINAHGGVLGRKIVPVWYEYDATSNQPYDSVAQAMCADFTQDHHVFAISAGIGGDAGSNAIIDRCAQQAGAVAINDDLSISSAQTFRQFPSYFEVSMMDLSRIVLNEARALDTQHYFTPWNATTGSAGSTGRAKVGIIAYDTSTFHYAVDRVLRPQLGQYGYAPSSSDVIYVTQPQRNSDVSQLSAQVSNAIVKFRQDGVEHVLIMDATALLTLEFLNQAESQHYFPRYGWNSQNGPEALAQPGNVPKDQLKGSMGVGWLPTLDLQPSDNPDNGPYSNAARRACVALLQSHGYSFSDANAKTVALSICEWFNFLQDALQSGGQRINQATFTGDVNRLGGSFPPVSTFTEFFSSQQHDGAGGYRYYAWNGGCGCMRYTSAVYAATGEGQ